MFVLRIYELRVLRAWLAQLVRSLPSDYEVPNINSIPSSAEILIFVRPSFPPKLTQLSILPGLVNEYSICWKLTCDGLVFRPGTVKNSHPLNTIETEDKRQLHGPLDS